MGATSSKSASSPPSSATTAIVSRAKNSPHTTKPAPVTFEEMMAVLLMNIMKDIPMEVGKLIIMDYVAIPSLLQTSPNSKQFFINCPKYTFFANEPLFDLDRAGLHGIWGRPAEVRAILEKNPNPSLLTVCIDGEDHRGPGCIPSGTLFQRALYVRDIYIKDNAKETMASMLKRYVIERCGAPEFEKQARQAHNMLRKEKIRKAEMNAADLKALNAVWDILTKLPEKNIKNSPELKTAMVAFKNQIKKHGNDTILTEAGKLYDDNYDLLGGQNSPKNNFIANQIVGFIQLKRLSVPDQQNFFTRPSSRIALNDREHQVPIKRVDVRRKLGVLLDSTPWNTMRLGSNCHLNNGGGEKACRQTADESGFLSAGWLSHPEKSTLEKLCDDLTAPQIVRTLR